VANEISLASPVSAFLQGRQANQENQLAQMRIQQGQEAQQRDVQFRQALPAYLTGGTNALAALYAADPERAMQAQQFQMQQNQLQQAQIVEKAKRAHAQASGVLNSASPAKYMQVLLPDIAKQWAAHNGKSPDELTDEDAKALASEVAAQAGAAAGIDPKLEEKDLGDRIAVIDPLTGRTLREIPKAATPGEKLSAQTSRANNAATVAATIRGQDITGADKGIPQGYEKDPANPGALRPIAGGPHDPNSTSTGMDSRSSVMFNRVAASAQAASKAISNIMELPVTTSSGFFGTAEPGHGLLDSARNVLAQKVTGQEAQDFKTMVAGVSRNLSTIETAGLAPNGAITNSMNAVLLGEGDTQMTKLRKMAEMRQIVEENLKPQLANPKLAPAQKDLVREIIGNVQRAVPFTHHDITLLQQSKDPKATIADFAIQKGLPTTGEITATGPGGKQLVLRNGRWVPK